MKRAVIAILVFSTLSFAQEDAPTGGKAWRLSLIPLVAAHSLDAASSWGYTETNPMLAGRDGRFGARSAAIKFSLVGAAAVAEYFLMKRHPKWAKLFTRANYGNSALTTGIAVRNFAVR